MATRRATDDGTPLPPDLARHERLALAVLLLTLGALGLFGAPSASVQAAFVVAAVMLSLPHGGADLPIAEALLTPRLGRAWLPAFLTGYLTLAGATLLAWVAVPALALTAFLAMSIAHFGLTDAPESGVPRGAAVVAHGAAPLVVPAVARPAELAELFDLLAGGGDDLVVLFGAPGAALWLVAVAVLVLRSGTEGRPARPLAELAAVCAGFALLPPLLAFSIYFGLLHAPRALAEAAARTGLGRHNLLVRSAWPSAAAFLFIAAGFVALDAASPSREAALRALFIGLSALTVPHMVLAVLARRRHRGRDLRAA